MYLKKRQNQVFAETFMSFAAGLKEKDGRITMNSHIRLLFVLVKNNVESAPFVVKSIKEQLQR